MNLCNSCPPFGRFISIENAYKTLFPNRKVMVIPPSTVTTTQQPYFWWSCDKASKLYSIRSGHQNVLAHCSEVPPVAQPAHIPWACSTLKNKGWWSWLTIVGRGEGARKVACHVVGGCVNRWWNWQMGSLHCTVKNELEKWGNTSEGAANDGAHGARLAQLHQPPSEFCDFWFVQINWRQPSR